MKGKATSCGHEPAHSGASASSNRTGVSTHNSLGPRRCGCVLVANHEQELLGIFTDGDLRRTIQTREGQIMGLRIGDIMTRGPRQCSAGEKAVEAMQVRRGAQEQ